MIISVAVFAPLTLAVSMSAAQSAAFSAHGAWLSPALVNVFFASIFAALALFMLSSLMMDCYQAWLKGDIKIGEVGGLILEFTLFVTVLVAVVR